MPGDPEAPPARPNLTADGQRQVQSRLERQAAQLRANLKRRKQQSRARADGEPGEPEPQE